MSEEFLDSSIVESLQEIMGEDFALLINTFMTDSVQRLEQLKQCYGQGSADEVRRVAHSLKGSASNIGAFRLAGYCAAIESAALAGALDQLDGEVLAVATELELVNGRLADYLSS